VTTIGSNHFVGATRHFTCLALLSAKHLSKTIRGYKTNTDSSAVAAIFGDKLPLLISLADSIFVAKAVS
jgi:hypothetical protein